MLLCECKVNFLGKLYNYNFKLNYGITFLLSHCSLFPSNIHVNEFLFLRAKFARPKIFGNNIRPKNLGLIIWFKTLGLIIRPKALSFTIRLELKAVL